MSIAAFHDSCRELAGDLDQKLKAYVTPTKALAALESTSSDAAVAVGLKGTGKSSAYRYLTEFKVPDVVVAINPDSYEFTLPARNLHYAAARKQFEHDLVLEALRAIVNAEDRARKKGATAAMIAAARKQVTSYLETVKKAAGRVKGFGGSILGCGFTIQVADAQTSVGLLLRKDIESAREALKKICDAGVVVRIVIDDPEHVFSATKDLDTHLLGGLCLAAIGLRRAIKNFKVVIFLKTHVYHPVAAAMEDLSKYPDHMVRLTWTRPELLTLIERRLSAASLRIEDLFKAKAATDGKQIIEQMVPNIRNGPRDLLRWLDLALLASNDSPVTMAHINGVAGKASRDAFVEMERAHFESYPQLGSVVKTIFKAKPSQQFSHREFAEHIRDLLINDKDMQALSNIPWMQRQAASTLPFVLFEAGALAFRNDSETTLPFEENYDLVNFQSAASLFLTPALRIVAS